MKHGRRIFIFLAAMFCMPSVSAQESAAPPPLPCSTEQYRQLDFWVGEWTASWTNPDGSTGAGTNSITKDEYGDCVIYERFSAPGVNGIGIKGMSVSTFHGALGKWRQTWVDNQGGYFALIGGPVEGEDHIFALELSRQTERVPYLRMIWQDVTEDAFVWRWQGRANTDEPWQDRWVINYERAK